MLFSSLNKYRDVGLLILRIGVGFTFIFLHGYSKITAGVEGWRNYGGTMKIVGITFAPEFWGFMSAFAEFFGGILLFLGLLFRPAMILLVINMAVAFASTYTRTGTISQSAWPLEILTLMVALFIIGPGKYSLDQLIFKGK
jgi:putative oxidoreductase